VSEKKAAEMIGQLSKENERLKEEKQELLEAAKKMKRVIDYNGYNISIPSGKKMSIKKYNEFRDKWEKVIQQCEGDNDE